MSDLGPLDTLTAEELCHHLAHRPAPEKVVDLPEMEHLAGEPYKKIKFVIPPDSADSAARIDALCHIRNELKKRYKREIVADDLEPQIVKNLVGDRCAKEMLARVLFAPVDLGTIGDTDQPIRKRVFTSADHIESTLHPDVIAILFGLFCTVRRELGPRPSVADDPQTLQEWIDRLKEGAWSLGPLEWLASVDLQELCCLAIRLLSDLLDCGLPLLSPQFMDSLRGLVSTQTSSDSDSGSSGEPVENSIQSTDELLGIPSDENLTAEKALELATKLRRR